MVWFKVDDSLPDHPKTLAMQGNKSWKGALALWTLAGAWCSKHLTDGDVPRSVVQRLGGTVSEAAVLVEHGFWEETPTGFRFHDWESRNPTRASVETARAKTRQRVAKHNAKQKQDSVDNAAANAVSDAVPNYRPVPSRPVRSEADAASVQQQPLLRPPEVSVGDVSREWHAAATPGVLHGQSGWRGDYGEIADAINRHPKIRPENRHRVLTKLCLWVWQDPEGPRARGVKITPAVVSKRVTEDIDAAVSSMWVASRLPLEGAA